MPETLYPRDRNAEINQVVAENGQAAHGIKRRFGLLHHQPGRHLTWDDFLRPFYMFRYPSVYMTCAIYGVGYSYSTLEPAVTFSSIFHRIFGWLPGQVGLALGLSTLIGAGIGEIVSGPISDLIVRRARLAHGGEAPAEVRLKAILPGAFFVPAGLLIYGFTIQCKRCCFLSSLIECVVI
jgi:hypothetical protein